MKESTMQDEAPIQTFRPKFAWDGPRQITTCMSLRVSTISQTMPVVSEAPPVVAGTICKVAAAGITRISCAVVARQNWPTWSTFRPVTGIPAAVVAVGSAPDEDVFVAIGAVVAVSVTTALLEELDELPAVGDSAGVIDASEVAAVGEAGFARAVTVCMIP